MTDAQRATEFIMLAYAESFELPMPVEEIIALEDAGHVVDLTTGQVITNGAEDRIDLSVIGSATLIVIESEVDR